MKKLLVLLSFLFIINTVNALEDPKVYLQKVLNNLEKVESASYTSLMNPGNLVIQFRYSFILIIPMNTIIRMIVPLEQVMFLSKRKIWAKWSFAMMGTKEY